MKPKLEVQSSLLNVALQRLTDLPPKGTLFLDASTDPADGGPDGLRLDKNGNMYGSSPGGVWIISPEGEHMAHSFKLLGM